MTPRGPPEPVRRLDSGAARVCAFAVRLAAYRPWGTLLGVTVLASCTLSSEGTAPGGGATSSSSTGTGGGAATSSSSGTTSSSSGGGSTSSTTSSGTGGAGGATPCSPGETQPCYSGPAGTEGIGACVAGTATCLPDGSSFGDCEGEVLPTAENCGAPGDEDCSGTPNDSCPCEPGDIQSCYSGPVGTDGVGPCQGGNQTCNPDGQGYGSCVGEVVPKPEACDGLLVDDDCDGTTNEASGVGCVCDGGVSVACYSGPPGTQGVGPCVGGTQSCNAEGTILTGCVGEVIPTLDTCATAADEDCDGIGVLCTGSHVWSKRFGTDKDQLANDVATYNTDIYVTGQFQNLLDLGLGTMDAQSNSKSDIFLAKLDTSGVTQWQRRFGQNNTDELGLALDTDGAGRVALTGSVEGSAQFDPGAPALSAAGAPDVSVAVFDAAGNHVFSRLDGDGTGRGVAFDGAGNLLVGGDFTGTLDFGGGTAALSSGGSSDAFVVSLDPSGKALWSRSFGGSGTQLLNDLAVDGSGNAFLCGRNDGTLALGGGAGTLTSAGGGDAFVAKLDTAGNALWARQFGDLLPQVAYTLVVDGAGDVYVGGSFQGFVDFGGGAKAAVATDMFLVKLSGATGTTLWVKVFGGIYADEVRSLAVDALGSVVFTGTGQGIAPIDFGGGALIFQGADDFALVKLDSAGNHVWSQRAGDNGSQRGLGVATDSQSNTLAVGSLKGSADFGGGALATAVAGTADVFIAKFAP